MARPIKRGLDYFELDCRLNEKVKLIEAEYGLIGFAVIVKLYQKIYGERGYYCEWRDDNVVLFLSELGGNCGTSCNLIKEIVSASIRRGIFSKELYEKHRILTSVRIQEQYLNAVSRREKVELEKEYLLVKVNQNQENDDNNSINVNRNSINVNRNPQRKEKKRKEEKRKENYYFFNNPEYNERLEEMREKIRKTNAEYKGGKNDDKNGESLE